MPLEMGPKEYAQQVVFAPVRSLASVLVSDGPFLEVVRGLREHRDAEDIEARIDEATFAYVPYRRGASWAGMRRVIELCVLSDSEDFRMQVMSVTASSCFVEASVEEDDPRQWTHAKNLLETARMVARLGDHRCVVCGEKLAGLDGTRRRYCGAHEGEATYRGRADREAIAGLLAGVAAALPSAG